MGFFSDIFDSISGKANQDLIKAQMQNQLSLAQQQLEEQKAEAALKYDPERAAQQAKMVGYVVAGIVIVVLGYFLIRYIANK